MNTINPTNHPKYNIYTMTVIVNTNCEVNLFWLYNILDAYNVKIPYNIKNNKELVKFLQDKNVPYGSIIRIEYKDQLKGANKFKKTKKPFRNTLSVVFYVDKLINVKIPIKGKLQLTGCTNDTQAINCIKLLYDSILKYEQQDYETYFIHPDINEPETIIKCVFKTVMTNIMFDLGFHINREALDSYMNSTTEFNSWLETSFGYTGVKIKIPFEVDDKTDIVNCLTLDSTGEWSEFTSPYLTYKSCLEKEKKKPKRNTFLVFHSGTIIMSGMVLKYMNNVYNDFVKIVLDARDTIEEKIDID